MRHPREWQLPIPKLRWEEGSGGLGKLRRSEHPD